MTSTDRWSDVADQLLGLGALAFLAAWSVPILRPGLGPGPRLACAVALTLSWALMALDYVIRLKNSGDWRGFVRTNKLRLLVVILPVLGPARLVAMLVDFHRSASARLRGRVSAFAVVGAALLVYCGGVLVLQAERGHPDANITSAGDAFWWAMTTVTTVGYGDRFPVTTQGRLIAAGLILAGIAVLGAVTAALASWLLGAASEPADETSDLRAEIAALRSELAQHREAIASVSETGLPPGRSSD